MLIGLVSGLVLLALVLLWPELALAIVLWQLGHEIVAIVALFTTVLSGKGFVVKMFRRKS